MMSIFCKRQPSLVKIFFAHTTPELVHVLRSCTPCFTVPAVSLISAHVDSFIAAKDTEIMSEEMGRVDDMLS